MSPMIPGPLPCCASPSNWAKSSMFSTVCVRMVRELERWTDDPGLQCFDWRRRGGLIQLLGDGVNESNDSYFFGGDCGSACPGYR